MRPSLSSKTEYVQVERKVSTPVTTMESVTVNRPQVGRGIFGPTLVNRGGGGRL
jgi:hypothetical protein